MTATLTGIAGLILFYCLYNFPFNAVDARLILLTALTIFFSSRLRIQLPRTKIHLTVSDALLILVLLLYGGEIAVILGALETGYTSLTFRRKGINIKAQTVLSNISITVIAVFVTTLVERLIFVSPIEIARSGETTDFVMLLSAIALSLFLVSSVLTSTILFIRGQSSKSILNEYCLNSLVMYIGGATLAGATVRTLYEANVFLLLYVIIFFVLVYVAYKRNFEDVKRTAELAEQAERERAEQAERHVSELETHLTEQQRISQELRSSEERFRHAAFHDELTGLPNRNYLMDVLEKALRRSQSEPEYQFAVMFLDLIRFKTINESLGHSTGDKLLQSVGARLKSIVEGKGILVRFGGDEFCLLIDDAKAASDVEHLVATIRENLDLPFDIGRRQIFVNVAIGISIGNDAYREAEDVLRDADIALYRAKASSKSYEMFDVTMHDRAVRLLQVETDLRYAIERREFEAYYQPIVSLNTLHLAGFESLIRWNHPQKGLVPPNDFIQVSEDTGLIIPITYWMLEESCRQIVEWQACHPHKPLFISVNLSGKHFSQTDLVEKLREIIASTGVEPSNLKLEITESAVMENVEKTIETLKRLKTLGVRISIDDFGTGYSSLSCLHRFPIDTLKVDRSFVSAMDEESENGAIVRTILGLAETLGLEVIAEGIETIYQLRQLHSLKCEYGQGYLISRPLPADKIANAFIKESPTPVTLPDGCDLLPLESANQEIKVIG